MRKTIARVYTILVILILAVTLIIEYGKVKSIQNDLKEEAGNAITETKQVIEKSWFKHKTFRNEDLSKEMAKLFEKYPHYKSLLVYSGELGFKYGYITQPDHYILSELKEEHPSWDGRPRYDINEFSTDLTRTHLQINETGMYFDTLYTIFPLREFKPILWELLFVLVALLVLTFILIFIIPRIGGRGKIDEYDDDFFDEMNTPQSDEDSMSEFDMPESSDDEFSLDDLKEGEDLSLDFEDDFSLDLSDSAPGGEGGSDDDFSLDFDEGAEDNDFGDFSLDLDEPGDSEKFSLDMDEDSDDLGDFSLDMDEDAGETSGDLDDFSLDMNEESDDLGDFSLDMDEDSEETSGDLDDFSLDMSEESDDLGDFSLDMEEDSEETSGDLDDFSLDMDEESVAVDHLDDFSLDIDEEISESTEDLGDFSLEIDEEISESTEDLGDFSLEMDEEVSESTEDLGDFSLDMDEEISESTEDLGDFSLDMDEEVSESTEDLDDFSLDMDEEVSEFSEDLGDFSMDLDEETSTDSDPDDFSLDMEEAGEEELELDPELEHDRQLVEEVKKNIEDISLELNSENTDEDGNVEEIKDMAPEMADSLDLDIEDEAMAEFALDREDFVLDEEEPEGLSDVELEEEVADDIFDEEIADESSDLGGLPEMDIELEEKSDFRTAVELNATLSSGLEKAAVTNKNLSVVVIQKESRESMKEFFSMVEEHFSDMIENIFDDGEGTLAVVLPEWNMNQALESIKNLTSEAESRGLDITAGISSKEGRIVGENRLLGEATMAIQKAKEAGKKAMAFKPDPGKYNEFIASH